MEHLLAFISVAAVMLAILAIGRVFVRHRFDVMFLALLLMSYWYAFRPVQLALALDTPAPDYLFPDGYLTLLMLAEATALLWCAGFALGAYSADVAGRPVMAFFPRLRGEPNVFLVLAGLAATTALALAVTAWLFASSGGSLSDSIRYVKAEKAVTGFYFLRQFAVIGTLLSIFTLYYLAYLRRVRDMRVSLWWTAFVLGCFAINSFGVYAWGQRYAIAMASVGLVAGYHFFIHRLSYVRLGLFALLFLSFFLGLRLIRDELLFTADIVTPLDSPNILRKIAVSMHGSQFDALLLVIRDFDLSAGLRWGEDFWAGVSALVPRQFWPDRPSFNPGAWFRQIYEPETLNGWPITPVGEWLVNFGYIGVAVGGALSGFIVRAAQRAYFDIWRNPWSMMMAVVVALFLLPGGVTAATPQSLLSTLFPLALVALLLRIAMPIRRTWGDM